MNNHYLYYIYKYTCTTYECEARAPARARAPAPPRRCCIGRADRDRVPYRTIYAAAAALQLAWCDHDNTRVADQQHAVCRSADPQSGGSVSQQLTQRQPPTDRRRVAPLVAGQCHTADCIRL